MEEEIDLRRYVAVVFKYKFLILGLAVLAAAVAFVSSSRRPNVYQAEASLAMLRERSEIVLEPKFKTLSEEQLSPRIDLTSLRSTLMTLVNSSSVAAAVLKQMPDQLDGVVSNVEDLRAKVQVSNIGNLIIIRVTDRDPQLVAEIANVWAQQAELYINAIYAQPGQPIRELEAQVLDVQSRYQTVQGDLEAFLTQNQIPELEREIQSREDLIAGYQQALTTNQAEMYNLALANNLRILSDYYAKLAGIERVLVDVETLRVELGTAGAGSARAWGEALALIGLQDRALGGGGRSLQITLDGEAPSVSERDVTGLIAALQEKKASVQAAIEQKQQLLLNVELGDAPDVRDNPLSQRIQLLTVELLAFQSRLEAEMARKRELAQVRDLAWETYQTVARKLAEAQVSEQVSGSEVRLASPAIEPARPVGRGRLTNTVVAGLMGVALGVFGALLVDWWRQQPIKQVETDDDKA